MEFTMEIPLPVHIVEVIFSKLSISNLPNCRLVCRAWNDLVLNAKLLISKGSFLALTHDFDGYPNPNFRNPKIHCVDTDTLTMVASSEFNTDYHGGNMVYHCCNGLFFLSKFKPTKCLGILNPITNQFFHLPEFKLDDDDDDEIISFGFGFGPKTNQYKLFRIIKEGNNTSSTCRMEVFRFSTHDQWSLVSNTLPFANYKIDNAYLNGFLYWIVKKENARDECVMNVFNVETENFESKAVLKFGRPPKSIKIESFHDFIYVTGWIGEPWYIFEIWRMQGKDSCTRDFVVDCRDFEFFDYCDAGAVHLVKAFEDGTMLIIVDTEYYRLDKTGQKVEIQAFDLDARLVTGTCYLSYFNFGSLPHILTGHG